MGARILTVTVNPTIDMTTKTKQVMAEHKLRCKDVRYDPGGGGINVARAVKKLGGDATAMFLKGGAAGETLMDKLKHEKVDSLPVEINNPTRTNITVTEESSDKQFRFVLPGPDVKKSEWKEIFSLIENFDEKPEYIVASGSLPNRMPQSFYADLAKFGNEQGSKVVVDTSGKPLKLALNEGLFLLKPNLRELQSLVGEEFESDDELVKATEKLLKKSSVQCIVVSLGTGGAFVATRDVSDFIRAPIVPIKSKVGAGDSMVGGIMYALSEGMNFYDAALYGVAAGSAAVMTPGIELCRKNDTERLFKLMQEDKI